MKPEPLPTAHPGDLARLCAQTGLMLLQHGAESALIESLARRLGLALGADGVEVALMANAITVTVLIGNESRTTVRRNEDRGINMHMVMQVQAAVLEAEEGRLDRAGYAARLATLRLTKHPRWLVVLTIGLSCACFARLTHADLTGCTLAFAASAAAMAVRQQLAHWHFSPLVGFFAAAFVATSVSAQGLIYHLGETPKEAMAASVLLLVPGFPLINAVSDMVKGYINTGLSRATMALLLAGSTCGGIVLAMWTWQVWGWVS